MRGAAYAAVAAAGFFFHRALAVSGLVRAPRWRILALLLLLLGYGISFVYRGARPDSLCLLLASALFLLAVLPPTRLGRGLIVLAAALAAMTSLPLLGELLLFSLALWLAERRRFAELSRLLLAGAAAGLSAVLLFYARQGVLGQFWQATFFSWHIFGDRLPDLVSGQVETIGSLLGKRLAYSARLIDIQASDLSSAALLLFCLICGGAALAGGQKRQAKVPLFCLLLALLAPSALTFVGKWRTYYSWTAYLPLIVATAIWLEQPPPRLGRQRGWQVARLLLPALALGCGLPLRFLVSANFNAPRSDRALAEYLHTNIRASDWVFAEWPAYYHLVGRPAPVFLPLYAEGENFSRSPEKPPPPIDLLFIDPQRLPRLRQQLGGVWRNEGRDFCPPPFKNLLLSPWSVYHLAPPPRCLSLYRRLRER